jgi:hypothetical protein
MSASLGKWTAAGAAGGGGGGDGLSSRMWWSARNLEKTLSAAASGLAARGAEGRKSSQRSPSTVLGADLYLSSPDEAMGCCCTGRLRSLDSGEPYIKLARQVQILHKNKRRGGKKAIFTICSHKHSIEQPERSDLS